MTATSSFFGGPSRKSRMLGFPLLPRRPARVAFAMPATSPAPAARVPLRYPMSCCKPLTNGRKHPQIQHGLEGALYGYAAQPPEAILASLWSRPSAVMQTQHVKTRQPESKLHHGQSRTMPSKSSSSSGWLDIDGGNPDQRGEEAKKERKWDGGTANAPG